MGCPPWGCLGVGGASEGGYQGGKPRRGGERHVPVHCPGRLFSFCPGGRGQSGRASPRQSPPASCSATARVALRLALKRRAKRRGARRRRPSMTSQEPHQWRRPSPFTGPTTCSCTTSQFPSAGRRAGAVHPFPPGPFPHSFGRVPRLECQKRSSSTVPVFSFTR
jgi:hypothetical protein